jgi:hypothetical protein
MGTPTTLKGWLERIAQLLAIASAVLASIKAVTKAD